MRSRHLARRIFLAPAAGLALALAIAACSSSSSSPSSSSTQTSPPSGGSSSGAVAEITANWEKFFSSSTPISEKAALLQNGSSFASAMGAFDKVAPSGLGAKVTGVTLTSATAATVKYNIVASSSTLLPNQTGQAVLQGGTWKVGDASFCGLLKLVPGGSTPAACSSS